jgi:methylated-DNA-[protein]-cysteine S-methyltransferase
MVFFMTHIQFTFKKMETVYIKTPLGIAAITGDVNGVSEIVLEEGEVSAQIPVFLRDAVQQLQEYFNSQRTDFTFKLNPKELIFNKSWNALLDIPFGKTRTYLEQSKFRRPKSHSCCSFANGKTHFGL